MKFLVIYNNCNVLANPSVCGGRGEEVKCNKLGEYTYYRKRDLFDTTNVNIVISWNYMMCSWCNQCSESNNCSQPRDYRKLGKQYSFRKLTDVTFVESSVKRVICIMIVAA